MKKILCFLLILFSLKSFAQYPNGIQAIGNDSNVVDIKGALRARVINKVFTDTSTANLSHMDEYPGAQIFTTSDNQFWLRNSSATQWIPAGGAGISIINIITDSSISICNFNSCDTFITNVTAQLVTILDDSTLLVCDTLNVCDTLHIPRTQFAQTLFDTTTIYQNIQNVYNYFSDTSFTNQFFPRGDGVLLDTVIRITDSTLRFIYTDGTQKEDTFRIALTQENITNITNIINYIDSLRGNDTTFILSANFNGNPILRSTTDSSSGNDSLHYEYYHPDIVGDSVLTLSDDLNADGTRDLKMKLVTSGGGAIGNIGSGYRWITSNGINAKTLFTNYPLVTDSSSNTNALTVSADTTDGIGAALATQWDLSQKADSVDLLRYVFTNPTNYSFLRIDSPNNRIINSHLTALAPVLYNEATNVLSVDTTDAIKTALATQWDLSQIGSGWGLTGNAGTTAGTNFLGTTDNVNLIFKRNNVLAGKIDSNAASSGITSFGLSAGRQNTASDLTAFGWHALPLNTSGTANTAVGNAALATNVSGTNNTAVGRSALTSVTGSNNVGIGNNAAQSVTGGEVVAIGPSAMISYTGSATGSIAIGSSALTAGSAADNIAIGKLAMGNGTNTGAHNIAIGQNALNLNSSGANNIGIGFNAGHYNTTLSNRGFINGIDLTNILGDTIYSPFYWRQSSIKDMFDQPIRINGMLQLNNGVINRYQNINADDTAKGSSPISRMTSARRTGLTSRLVNAAINAVGTVVQGSGYTSGTYTNVPLTGGSGTNALATIIVGAGAVNVTSTITFGGYNYAVGDVLSAPTSVIGAGTGFTITVVAAGIMPITTGTMVYDTTINAETVVDTLNTWKQVSYWKYKAVTGTYTATKDDYTLDATSGTFTITLPTAVGISGRKYNIVNSGSGTITLGTTSSQTFVNINTAPTTLTLAAVGAGAIVAYEVQSNGANWIVTGKVKNE